ncbi:hypothetical protein [Desulfosediminicola flagellatus]|uniref:hypothetical protein n=1 Tax=Desulfosediminicola flagellatus TaxID=2569541 RepID=UPI0010ABA571|nr:hypothetical protein [Desulfosediminicola flagellatus]
MDVSMGALNAQAMSLNKASVGQEILLKTLEKSEGTKLNNTAMESRPVEKAQTERQGRINLYA